MWTEFFKLLRNGGLALPNWSAGTLSMLLAFIAVGAMIFVLMLVVVLILRAINWIKAEVWRLGQPARQSQSLADVLLVLFARPRG